MRDLKDARVNRYRAKHPRADLYDDAGHESVVGLFLVPLRPGGPRLRVLAGSGLGWDHVSVSLPDRCPTWAEMCRIKDLFFSEDECVVQYHPAKADYVNVHPYTLHLWRPHDQAIPTPPRMMV